MTSVGIGRGVGGEGSGVERKAIPGLALSLFQPFKPIHDGHDTWHWTLAADGDFTVRNLSRSITTHYSESYGGETKWCSVVPKKVNIFLWRAVRPLIPARANLQDRRLNLETILCPLCSSAPETTDHILVSCSVSTKIW